MIQLVCFSSLEIANLTYSPNSVPGKHAIIKDKVDHFAEQWERDRNKKAERKRAREAERRLNGGLGKGSVKGKGTAKGSNLDLDDIEQIMRSLVADPSRDSHKLPALDKETRVQVHKMAIAFSLKSVSAGSKSAKDKVMTLSKTKKTRRPINEKQINSIMRRNAGITKHLQEGEVIGHKAEKISSSNIGYKLLEKMGFVLRLYRVVYTHEAFSSWTEGDRIGIEGGLEVPLTVVSS